MWGHMIRQNTHEGTHKAAHAVLYNTSTSVTHKTNYLELISKKSILINMERFFCIFLSNL